MGDFCTPGLFTVVEKSVTDVLLGSASINEHVLAARPDEQKVNILESTLVALLKKHDVSANAVFAKENTQK